LRCSENGKNGKLSRSDCVGVEEVTQLTSGMEQSYLKIIFWNCHGINNLYNLDSTQRKIFNSYSIVCLCETWSLNTPDIIPIFEGYKVIKQDAIRNNNSGRASGGLIILIKNTIKSYVMEINDFFIFVVIEGLNFKVLIGNIYLKPCSVRDGLKELKNFLSKFDEVDGSMPIILGGDFNCRIGNLNQSFDGDIFNFAYLLQERVAHDRLLNMNGRKLIDIMESNLFFVVNGRSISDSPGNYTFTNANGSSTVDFVWVNLDGVDCIIDMEVRDFVLLSDHLPVSVVTNFMLSEKCLSGSTDKFKEKLIWKERSERQFETFMQSSNRLELIKYENDSSRLYLNLVNAIKESAAASGMIIRYRGDIIFKNKPWFDFECNILKRDVRRLYRLAKSKHFERDSVNKYLAEKSKYRNMLRTKKIDYNNKLRENLCRVNNPREFWRAVNFFKDKCPNQNYINMETWVSFLRNKYHDVVAELKFFQDARHPFLDREIDIVEFEKALKNSKSRKSPGLDNVQVEFYKALPPDWKNYMLELFNKIMNSENIPAEWGKIKMFFLYKKGDKTDPRNYRGIALINSLVKIFTTILRERLSDWAEKSCLLPECQSGFRSRRSCVDNIFVLQSLVYQQVEFYKKRMFALFVDFESAFDSVPHSQLWNRLGEMGVSGRTIRLFDCLYSCASIVMDDERRGLPEEHIPISKGVLQGEAASPLLFSLYLNDLESFLRRRGLNGIPVSRGSDILMLMFADDIVILADSSVDLRNKLIALNEYCMCRKLVMNIGKTKIVPFHKGRLRKVPKFYINNKEIEMINSYTYLGVEFGASGRFRNYVKTSLNKAKGTGESIIKILGKAKSDTWESKMKLYDAVLLPSLLYSSEVWGHGYEEVIEKAQLNFLKRLLLLNKSTPNWALRLETGRLKLGHLIFRRVVNWLQKVLNMPEGRYPKVCFNKLIEIDRAGEVNEGITNTLKLNWIYGVRENFRLAGMESFWSQGEITGHTLRIIRNSLLRFHADTFRAADVEKSLESRTFGEYRLLNPNFEKGEQLLYKGPIAKVRCVSQWRMATQRSLYLHIGGRGMYIDCTKVCPLCNTNLCDTAIHFLFRCPMFGNIRMHHIEKYTRNIVQERDRLMVLLSNLTEDKINNIYCYTIRAVEIRETICSVG
jgi:exonuclease III